MSGARVSARAVEDQKSGAIEVKICGVTAPEHLVAAAEAGARWIGFVFEPRSPRAVTPERAAELARSLAGSSDRIISHVGLWVDPSDATLAACLSVAPIDTIQLHGSETPERVAAIKARFGLPVMKAISIGEAADLQAIDAYSAAADLLLIDAKPPKGDLKGGGGVAFDWGLIAGLTWMRPWLLAGGLTAENVAEAVRATGARAVDVSSGVESSRGVKDVAKIRAFIQTALSAG
ncbi:MAG: phosphoribosylanthranilate isomerase [Neomegalonema sp.]|nr:phosphoribosylanthranilate isomerase [Neomegalonema sp.]